MADTPDNQIEGVTVTGDRPIFSDPFAMDSFGLTDYLGGLSLNEYAQRQNEAFAPPLPEVLPEVIVTQPKVQPLPPTPPPPVVGGIGQSLLRLIPWLSIIVPGNMGPDGTGDAPLEPSTVSDRYGPPKPPPGLPNPVLAEPSLPPNWADLARGGNESLLEPIRAPGLPVPDWLDLPAPEPLDEVLVTPPKVVTKPAPTFPDLLPGSGFDLWLTPIGDPFGTPDFAPDPGPGPAPSPFSPPGVDPIPRLPDPVPFAQPGDRTAPLPFNPTAPDLFGAPLPDIIGNPIGDPFIAPPQPGAPSPRPGKPTAPGIPDFFADPFNPPAVDPFADPFPDPNMRNPQKPDQDTCKCDAKKKKKPKKRKPRAVCYTGTYQQRSKTTVFRPKEEVPCDAPLPKKTRAKRTRKPTPSWNDTLRDVFFPQP